MGMTCSDPDAFEDAVQAPGAHKNEYPKAALVTGAGQRIGKAIALALAEDGYAVALHYLNSKDQTDALAHKITSGGGKAVKLKADISREEEAARLIEDATQRIGPIGILINNASIFEMDTIQDADRRSWDRHIETNLRAPFTLTQKFAAALPKDECGLVVNLLDERVLALPGTYLSYTLSKSGLWSLTRSLAIALAPRIRVLGIGPGHCLPERGISDDAFKSAIARLPLRRSGPPSEVVAALRFFIACKSLTGQMIALDSGNHLIRRPHEDFF